MCVANSARSQMAEGLAKSIFGAQAEVESAGSNPSHVNPLAIEVMKEIGVDITRHYSKMADDLSPRFLTNLDYVITLCSEEVCPVLVSKAKKLRWPFPDPAGQDHLSKDAQLDRFREVRNAIQSKLNEFKCEVG